MTIDPSTIIKSFKVTQSLDEHVATILIKEFQKAGLILLPVGSTFEQGIYPLVNDYFNYEEYELRNTENQDSLFKDKHHKVDPELVLSHLDELITDEKKNIFSSVLKKSLKNITEQVEERFYSIDVSKIEDFDRFIKRGGGPRIIVLGLGGDPEIAHVAFIGEEFINSVTAEVKLSEAVAKDHKCERAVTIGTDIFDLNNLERIILVVKGKSKAEALAAAFDNPDTGLGYLIANHANKLEIFADEAALSVIARD